MRGRRRKIGGRLYALQLADFTPGTFYSGQAAYFRGRLAVDAVDLHARHGPWEITGSTPVPVPEPTAAALPVMSVAGVLLTPRRRR